MAGEPWNRVNILFPSATSTVHVQFTGTTATNVKSLCVENEKVLKLLRSEILQREVRVLSRLLYILNNSFRRNRTFKGMQLVEQCINRLKKMKLEAALQELADTCPKKIQRRVSIKTGECDLPSQPMLEWMCLKVLGAAQLLSCTLQRCCKAFILSKQQMKCEEFIILNVVITSLLSRLWIIFNGVLVSLSTLYQQLLELLRHVSSAKPMPYLTGMSLPTDLVQFLGPSQVFLMKKHPACDPHTKCQKGEHLRMTEASFEVMTRERTRIIKEDLGVAIDRDLGFHADIESSFKTFRKVKAFPEELHKTEMKQKLKTRVREATTFADMAVLLQEMIQWFKSQRMEKEKRRLSFLRLKCQKMKSLEAAGYNVQRKLQTFRREICWAASSQRSAQKIYRPPVAMARNPRLRSRLQSLKRRFMSFRVRTAVQKRGIMGKQRKAKLPVSGLLEDEERDKSPHEMTPQSTDSYDDIDDIFASVGL